MKRYFFLIGFAFLFACNQDTIIGTDLISDQLIDVEYSDTIDISAKSVLGDSLIVFTAGPFTSTNLSISLMGHLEDEYFGTTETAAFFNIGLSTADSLDWADASIDSVILTIPFDTVSTYGDTMAIHNFELFPLTENMLDRDTFRTNDWLSFDPMTIGTYSQVPAIRDSLEVYNPGTDTIDVIQPHLRIAITDNAYITNLIEVAHSADNDSTFRAEIDGFALQSKTDVNSITNLDFSNEVSSLRELTVYYTKSGDKDSYSFPIGARRSIAFQHDYSGSEAAEALNNQAFSDSILFIQSMQGLNIEVDLSSLRELDAGTVNYAELEFTIAMDPNYDLDTQAPIERIGAFWKNDEGNIVDIDDITIGDDIFFFSQFFNGFVDDSGENMVYKLVITNHVLDIINDRVDENKLILIAFNKQFFANRSIVYGPGHSLYPMKLKLVRT